MLNKIIPDGQSFQDNYAGLCWINIDNNINDVIFEDPHSNAWQQVFCYCWANHLKDDVSYDVLLLTTNVSWMLKNIDVQGAKRQWHSMLVGKRHC